MKKKMLATIAALTLSGSMMAKGQHVSWEKFVAGCDDPSILGNQVLPDHLTINCSARWTYWSGEACSETPSCSSKMSMSAESTKNDHVHPRTVGFDLSAIGVETDDLGGMVYTQYRKTISTSRQITCEDLSQYRDENGKVSMRAVCTDYIKQENESGTEYPSEVVVGKDGNPVRIDLCKELRKECGEKPCNRASSSSSSVSMSDVVDAADQAAHRTRGEIKSGAKYLGRGFKRTFKRASSSSDS